MHCVIYEFSILPEHSGEFQKIWHELTVYLRDNCNSLGSRLHQSVEDETKWVAYAQWPSRVAYENEVMDGKVNELRQRFLPTIDNIQILFQLSVQDDLLVPL